jgi:hypothetical protein
MPRRHWIDPCAGEGDIISAAHDVAPGLDWTAIELRPECRDVLDSLAHTNVSIGNFFAHECLHADVVCTNPPFRLAMEFILRSFDVAPIVAMLLRLNFLGSEDRSEFMRKTTPDLYVLPNRPAFMLDDKGKPVTDSIEYAWFVWRNGKGHGRYTLLPSTPLEVRKNDPVTLRLQTQFRAMACQNDAALPRN